MGREGQGDERLPDEGVEGGRRRPPRPNTNARKSGSRQEGTTPFLLAERWTASQEFLRARNCWAIRSTFPIARRNLTFSVQKGQSIGENTTPETHTGGGAHRASVRHSKIHSDRPAHHGRTHTWTEA